MRYQIRSDICLTCITSKVFGFRSLTCFTLIQIKGDILPFELTDKILSVSGFLHRNIEVDGIGMVYSFTDFLQ